MKKFLLSLSFIILALVAQAQCAMCKAVAGQGGEQEMTVGSGINSGIIFLIVAVYCCLSVIILIIIFFYRERFLNFWRELKNAGQ